MMASQLNPDAAEFVPVFPSGPQIALSAPQMENLLDDVMAQSPRKVPADDSDQVLNLPSHMEFATEVQLRPGETSPCNVSFTNLDVDEEESHILSGVESFGNGHVIMPTFPIAGNEDSYTEPPNLMTASFYQEISTSPSQMNADINEDPNIVQQLPLSDSDEECQDSKEDAVQKSFDNEKGSLHLEVVSHSAGKIDLDNSNQQTDLTPSDDHDQVTACLLPTLLTPSDKQNECKQIEVAENANAALSKSPDLFSDLSPQPLVENMKHAADLDKELCSVPSCNDDQKEILNKLDIQNECKQIELAENTNAALSNSPDLFSEPSPQPIVFEKMEHAGDLDNEFSSRSACNDDQKEILIKLDIQSESKEIEFAESTNAALINSPDLFSEPSPQAIVVEEVKHAADLDKELSSKPVFNDDQKEILSNLDMQNESKEIEFAESASAALSNSQDLFSEPSPQPIVVEEAKHAADLDKELSSVPACEDDHKDILSNLDTLSLEDSQDLSLKPSQIASIMINNEVCDNFGGNAIDPDSAIVCESTQSIMSKPEIVSNVEEVVMVPSLCESTEIQNQQPVNESNTAVDQLINLPLSEPTQEVVCPPQKTEPVDNGRTKISEKPKISVAQRQTKTTTATKKSMSSDAKPAAISKSLPSRPATKPKAGLKLPSSSTTASTKSEATTKAKVEVTESTAKKSIPTTASSRQRPATTTSMRSSDKKLPAQVPPKEKPAAPIKRSITSTTTAAGAVKSTVTSAKPVTLSARVQVKSTTNREKVIKDATNQSTANNHAPVKKENLSRPSTEKAKLGIKTTTRLVTSQKPKTAVKGAVKDTNKDAPSIPNKISLKTSSNPVKTSSTKLTPKKVPSTEKGTKQQSNVNQNGNAAGVTIRKESGHNSNISDNISKE